MPYAFSLAALILCPAAAPQAVRPNVLLIVADDMGCSDAGCYGGEIATPNLDSLARNGLRFTQFYNTARCWPSRAAILTGYYAQQVRRDTIPGVQSGSQGIRPSWARLLPEMLKPLGYRSYHSGKWHVDGKPLQNGFDRSYSLDDHDRHFTPRRHTEDDIPLPAVEPTAGYYSSTAIADHAIKYLQEHAVQHSQQPLLVFLAFTAPHFPLQAPASDIARYQGKYLAGWDALREVRWQRLKDEKIGGTELAPIERDLGPPYPFPEALKKLGPNELNLPLPWSELNAAQREFQANKMAVHAAMVDRMDREIGRVLAQIREMKAFDDTLIFFLSDNGASAEIMVRGDGHDPAAQCGTGATFLSIGPGWSSLCNTPFRRHKTWVHEGGISTPLIVHWPSRITARGELRHTPGHVIDLVPTILEAAGSPPKIHAGRAVPPAPGKSLIPVFASDRIIARESLWWLHEGNRALLADGWKIVAAGKESPWELYDQSSDRSETRNLATQNPAKVRQLAAMWDRQFNEHVALATPEIQVGIAEGDLRGNDNRALQAAVDRVVQQGGGTVRIGPGRYQMRNALILRSNVHVIGVPGQTILVTCPSARSRLALDGDCNERQITLANPADFQVGDGVTIQDDHYAGGFETTTATLISQVDQRTFKLSGPLYLDYLVSRNARADHTFPVVGGWGVKDVRVEGLTIDGNRGRTQYLNGCRGGGIYLFECERVQIRGCTIRDYNGDGISFQVSQHVSVENCVSEHNSGLGLHPGSGSQHPRLLHNRSLDNGGDGLFVCWRVQHGLFEDNEIRGNQGVGISIGHKDSDNLFRGNIVAGNRQAGLLFRNESEPMGAHRNRFENNRIVDNNTGGNKDGGACVVIRGPHHDLVFRKNTIGSSTGKPSPIGILAEHPQASLLAEDNEFPHVEKPIQAKVAKR